MRPITPSLIKGNKKNESHNLKIHRGSSEIQALKQRWYNINRFIARQRIVADTVPCSFTEGSENFHGMILDLVLF